MWQIWKQVFKIDEIWFVAAYATQEIRDGEGGLKSDREGHILEDALPQLSIEPRPLGMFF